jgi:uncharacterized membrane protein
MNTGESAREEKGTTRVEAFSDGVFAIAVTLLVLDLKVPQSISSQDLASVLLKQWPTFVAFLNSFGTILIIWMNHHNLFTNIKRTDNLFMLSNGILLLCVTFLPYPTSLVAEFYGHPGDVTAAALYSGTFFLMSIAFNLLWRYSSHNHRLLSRSVTAEEVESINRQYLVGPSFYGLAFVLSFVNVSASLLLTIALAGFYSVTASMSRKER